MPTLITGFKGINVPYPPGSARVRASRWRFVVMIGAVVALFLLSRRSDWL